jgi:hypothetical protein
MEEQRVAENQKVFNSSCSCGALSILDRVEESSDELIQSLKEITSGRFFKHSQSCVLFTTNPKNCFLSRTVRLFSFAIATTKLTSIFIKGVSSMIWQLMKPDNGSIDTYR